MLEVPIFRQNFDDQEISGAGISIVIPVYNQEHLVAESLRRMKTVVEAAFESFEIIIVNDGSLDNTLQVLQNESRKDGRVRVVSYMPNMGKGYAVKKGVMESRGKFVLFIDGDLDVSPDLIGDYILQLESHDLVIASKRHPLSKLSAPASRRFLSRAFNLIAKILTGVRTSDTQAGMKAGKGDVLKKIFEVMVVKRYAFDVELLAVASLIGTSIKEMQVDISLDRRFKVGDMWKMFRDVLAIGYRLRIKKWYQKQLAASLHDESEERLAARGRDRSKAIVDVSAH
jgi:dolichol-phosphate mannosyltransferase